MISNMFTKPQTVGNRRLRTKKRDDANLPLTTHDIASSSFQTRCRWLLAVFALLAVLLTLLFRGDLFGSPSPVRHMYSTSKGAHARRRIDGAPGVPAGVPEDVPMSNETAYLSNETATGFGSSPTANDTDAPTFKHTLRAPTRAPTRSAHNMDICTTLRFVDPALLDDFDPDGSIRAACYWTATPTLKPTNATAFTGILETCPAANHVEGLDDIARCPCSGPKSRMSNGKTSAINVCNNDLRGEDGILRSSETDQCCLGYEFGGGGGGCYSGRFVLDKSDFWVLKFWPSTSACGDYYEAHQIMTIDAVGWGVFCFFWLYYIYRSLRSYCRQSAGCGDCGDISNKMKKIFKEYHHMMAWITVWSYDIRFVCRMRPYAPDLAVCASYFMTFGILCMLFVTCTIMCPCEDKNNVYVKWMVVIVVVLDFLFEEIMMVVIGTHYYSRRRGNSFWEDFSNIVFIVANICAGLNHIYHTVKEFKYSGSAQQQTHAAAQPVVPPPATTPRRTPPPPTTDIEMERLRLAKSESEDESDHKFDAAVAGDPTDRELSDSPSVKAAEPRRKRSVAGEAPSTATQHAAEPASAAEQPDEEIGATTL